MIRFFTGVFMTGTTAKITSNMSLPRGRKLELSRTLVMGVLNVTPDSFSDGGQYIDPQKALNRAMCMIEEGADIIDIGGESSRPGSAPVNADEEMRRTIPIIEAIRKKSNIPVSIDTTKADVARQAIEAGADIINDISALRFDDGMANVAADFDGPVTLMHMLGTPGTMQDNPHYDDCLAEITQFFSERLEFCDKSGIDRARIILDPGIGFGKRLEDNLNIIKNLGRFSGLGRPLMIGASRKSFIQMITGIKRDADKRIGGSLAAVFYAVRFGCNIIRVHDVAETVETIKVINAIENYSS